MSEDQRRVAPAVARNREAILAVLRAHLPPTGTVLEIASGSGEHAAFFAEHLGLTFQPSDPDPEARSSINAWCAGANNIRPAIALDAAATPWPMTAADAVLCINMVHIAPWAATLGLMQGAAATLAPGAPLILYGPFRQGGAHTAPSNADFDASLRARDPAWGVRDLEAVAEAAHGFAPPVIEAMPANNLTVIFRRL